MKNMMKRIICVLAPLALMTVHASAADPDVVYDGTDLKLSAAAAGSATKAGLEPGGSATFDVTFGNQSKNTTSWYLSDEVITALEESGGKDGGYTYRLSYLPAGGSEVVLYDNTTVGGTGTAGLKEVNSDNQELSNYYFLDTLGSGAGGTVRLSVTLDGESQPNSYMNALGKIQLSFAVEETVPGTPKKKVVRRVIVVPNTGDDSLLKNPYLYSFGASLLILIVCGMMYLKMSRKAGGQA